MYASMRVFMYVCGFLKSLFRRFARPRPVQVTFMSERIVGFTFAFIHQSSPDLKTLVFETPVSSVRPSATSAGRFFLSMRAVGFSINVSQLINQPITESVSTPKTF